VKWKPPKRKNIKYFDHAKTDQQRSSEADTGRSGIGSAYHCKTQEDDYVKDLGHDKIF
jgi:hypothetical protein